VAILFGHNHSNIYLLRAIQKGPKQENLRQLILIRHMCEFFITEIRTYILVHVSTIREFY
jgi:hypothetical protein